MIVPRRKQRIALIAGGVLAALLVLLLLTIEVAVAHGVAGSDRAFLEQSSGRQLIVYAYLGAKHIVTGYDHLLFLFGVVFLLYRMRDVGIYVTLFAIGHSVTPAGRSRAAAAPLQSASRRDPCGGQRLMPRAGTSAGAPLVGAGSKGATFFAP